MKNPYATQIRQLYADGKLTTTEYKRALRQAEDQWKAEQDHPKGPNHPTLDPDTKVS